MIRTRRKDSEVRSRCTSSLRHDLGPSPHLRDGSSLSSELGSMQSDYFSRVKRKLSWVSRSQRWPGIYSVPVACLEVLNLLLLLPRIQGLWV